MPSFRNDYHCGNPGVSVPYQHSYIASSKDNQITKWLSPLEPQYRHQSVKTSRVNGVGGWFLEMNEFRVWSGSQGVSKQAVLFCYGDAGVGKTHISSLVIDWLRDQVHNRDIAVAALYCDYLAQEEQSARNMLGAILKQLLERDGIPEALRQVFREEKRGLGGRAMQLSDLVKTLKSTIASLPEVFICIDGLDECLPKNRRELLESLQDIVQASPTTRVFLTGRPDVQDEIKGYFTEAIMTPVIPTIRDIERHLEMRLGRDTTPNAMDDNLRAEIMRAIPRNVSQIFILLSLNIDAVLEEPTIHKRKKKLDQMIQGHGLRDAYSATLARIKAQGGSKSRLGMDMLMWLSHSQRPLKANELCDALGVEIGSADLDPQEIHEIESLLGCSLGLIEVEAATGTVRLVHYTLQEHLLNDPDLFHSPHETIAQVCLTYLNFQRIRDLSPFTRRPPPETPLLEYASCYWGMHARRGITKSVNALALRLLDGFDKHVSSAMLLSHSRDNWDRIRDRSNPIGFTGLHGAAYLGIVEVAVALLEMKRWDLGATDVTGNTAISWAARRGHEAMVGLLLAREDVSPNTADKGGRTPLLWAARNRHRSIVKMLLDRKDISPNTVDEDGLTPFSWEVINGHEDIVKMLLERKGVTPGAADKDGRTPLHRAVINKRADIVEMLLERDDVSPDIADKYGQTPLQLAVINAQTDIVKMLSKLEGVAPDTAEKYGQTPLSWAAETGHIREVETLLRQRSVSQGMPKIDQACQTALARTSLNSPVRALFLSPTCTLLLILATCLPILAYHVISYFCL